MGQSVGRTDGSIEGTEGRTDGSTDWTEGRIDATVILSCNFNRGKKMKQSERRKKKEIIKNSSNLMLRIETAINDSRFFCLSTLLCDWEWNGFDKFLKLIRSSSHFSALQCLWFVSLLLSFWPFRHRFGHKNIYKKINPGLSRVWPGRPGPGSTGSGRANSQPVFCLDPARPQARVGRVPGWPAGPGRVLKHWF